MKLKLDWLCAILAPREMSLHPNFFEEEKFTLQRLIATAVAFDEQTWRRAKTDPRFFESLTEADRAILRAVEVLVPFDANVEVSPALELITTLPPDQGTAIAILIVVALSAAERYEEGLALLRELRTRVQNAGISPDQTVLLAALALQEASRRYERGLEEDYAQLGSLMAALEGLLLGLSDGPWEEFEVSWGVGWSSSVTVGHVVEELQASFLGLRQNLSGPLSSGWQDLVRAPAPYLTLTNFRRAFGAQEALVQQLWRTGPYSSTRTVFAGDPILSPMRAALLHSELVGDPAEARQLRRGLALMLMVSPYQHLTVDRDGPVTLLRRSRDEETLRAALAKARAEGPLEPLLSDAARIVNHADPATIGLEACLVLDAAAQLLDNEQARRGWEATVAQATVARMRGYAPGSRWRSPSLLELAAWRAAVSLADVSGDVSLVMERLLGQLKAREDADPLFAQRLPAALMAVDWEALEPRVREEWLRWVETDLGSHDSPDGVATNLYDHFAWIESNIANAVRRAVLSRRGGLQLAASVVETLRADAAAEVPVEYIPEAKAAILSALDTTVQEAERGAFSFGGYSPAAIAAVAAVDLGWTDLWGSLLHLLKSPQVITAHKDSAFNVLADRVDKLPGPLLRSVRSAALQVVESPRDLSFGPVSLPPHPSCIAFLAAARHRTRGKAVIDTLVVRAVAHPDERGRRVAAQGIARIASTGTATSAAWLPLLLLQLAADREATVRADAAFAIGKIISVHHEWEEQLGPTLAALLATEGLMIPLAAVRGLADVRALSEQGKLRQALETVQAHPAGIVRSEAARVRARL